MTRPMREAAIDLDAITDNARHFVRLTGVEVIAVVKADGYGHGAVRAARAALRGGASRLGVASIDEALALRRAGIDAPILAWLHGPDTSFSDPVAQGIEIGVSSMEQLHRVAEASPGRIAGVHVKVDTGLSRNGVAPAEWPAVFSEAARLERIGRIHVVGIFSHLSGTSPADDLAALSRFREAESVAEAAGVRPPLRHLAATAAAITLPEARRNCVRIGIGLYGLSPVEGRSSAELGLRPAMTLRAPVAAVRRVPAGTGVSYGYHHRTAAETTLALVPLGYADGVPRQASSRGPVVIGGRRYTVAGRIAMDQLVIDVGADAVRVGDTAVLFGDPVLGMPAASEWADAADTIDYEIVTRIGARVTRTETDGDA